MSELNLSVARPIRNLRGPVRHVLGAVTLLPLLVGCSRKLESAECNRLLDRYTEFLVREEEPEATPEHVVEVQGRARAKAAQDERFEFSECPSRVRRSSYECAMSAPNVDSMERCLLF